MGGCSPGSSGPGGQARGRHQVRALGRGIAVLELRAEWFAHVKPPCRVPLSLVPFFFKKRVFSIVFSALVGIFSIDLLPVHVPVSCV